MEHDSVASDNPTPTGFRRLTGCKRDPRDRGATLCCDGDSAFNYLLCRNMNFFVATPLIFLFNFLSRQRIHLLHVLFVAIDIIFLMTKILLLLVVNSEC